MRVTRSIVPNLFTLANLFCGFAAIIAALENSIERAAFLILLSGIFDALDGVVARLTRSASEFGVELDSLCDAVSFGVAPSVILYMAFFHSMGNWGQLLASLPALAGVLRLARFNVQLTSLEDKHYFRGMPIPAGAFAILSYVVFVHPTTTIPEEWKPLAITTVTVLVALAMVSTIKYDNLPRPTIGALRQRPIIFVVFLVGAIGSLLSKGLLVFPFMALYMIGGALRQAIHLMRARRDDNEESDTVEEPDPDPFDL
ncbi:CDP-diacylglycerol--serine O-phosphatidyltransferase [soil metagenome]